MQSTIIVPMIRSSRIDQLNKGRLPKVGSGKIILSTKLRLYPFMPIQALMDEERFGRPVHIWTIKEILDLPGLSIWFYGLVKREDGSASVSEIYPGCGCCNFEIYKDDFDKRPEEEVIKEIYADIGYDILRWNPGALKAEYLKQREEEKSNRRRI
jgi:hypothetical protein